MPPPGEARGTRRGHAKLLDSKVTLVGADVLDCPAALYLAAVADEMTPGSVGGVSGNADA